MMLRLQKATIFLLLLLIGFSGMPSRCLAAGHAYITSTVWVSNANGKHVTKLPKGITIKYTKIIGDRIQFDYFGKRRFLPASKTIRDSILDSYVRRNPTKFNLQADTLQKACIYNDINRTKVIKKVAAGTSFKIFKEFNGWFKVQLDGTFGYLESTICKKYCVVDVTTFPSLKGSTTADKIVNYAKQFLGNPYVWGGTSLTTGCDCSGFVQSIFKNFGYTLPRCSYEQAEIGKDVSFNEMKPGDLIFYYRGSRIGHVTMYIGNGKVIQARGRKYGIVITDWNYSSPAFAKRIL